MFGYSQEELCGRPIEDLVPENLRAAHVGLQRTLFRRCPDPSHGVGLDIAGRRKDGSQFPVEVSLSPVRSEDDRLIISSCVMSPNAGGWRGSNLSGRRPGSAEQAHLLDLAYDAILVRDMDGTVSYWNHGPRRCFTAGRRTRRWAARSMSC